MKKFICIITFVLLVSGFELQAQTIKGKVYGVTGNIQEVLEGAVVKYLNSGTGTETDSRGFFSLPKEDETKITVSMVGFQTDTIDILGETTIFVYLQSNLSTEEITILETRNTKFSGKEIIPTEIMTQGEFKKSSCCDLSGCFGTSVSVESRTTDAVLKLKELKLLGLEGQYTQILFDGIPIVSGLNAKYGMGGIPGSLIASINISKGTNSVLQGYESMSGIINVIPKDINTSEMFFLNGYMNGMMEKQLNLNTVHRFGKWSSILSGHITGEPQRQDKNADGFLDAPLINRQMIYNKWSYMDEADGLSFELSGRFNNEKIIGGQTGFNESHIGSNQIYGQVIDFKILDVYTKAGKVFNSGNELKFFAGISRHDNKSWLGRADYKGVQDLFWVNSIYTLAINKDANISTGVSYRYNNLNETVETGSVTNSTTVNTYNSRESFPGVFTEISWDNITDRLSVLAGVRADFHNEYNTIVTPRTLLKYELTDNTLLRASIGTGFRVPKVFIENMNILSGSKSLIVENNLNPDKIINYGLSVTHDFNMEDVSGFINLDFYRSDFNSRVITIYDREPGKVFVENMNGNSHSNVFQSEVNINLPLQIGFTGAYKFTEFIVDHNGLKQNEPFVPKHQLMGTLSYIAPGNDWMFDLIANWFGKRPLPSTEFNPPQYRLGNQSEPYTILNFQVTKVWNMFEFYAGVENIFDKKQSNPIIAADDPFGPYFDTSFIYGPTSGREFYGGFRFKILD